MLYAVIFSQNGLFFERITLFAYYGCSLLFDGITSANRGSKCQIEQPQPKISILSYQICSKKTPITPILAKCSDILHVGFLFDQFGHTALQMVVCIDGCTVHCGASAGESAAVSILVWGQADIPFGLFIALEAPCKRRYYRPYPWRQKTLYPLSTNTRCALIVHFSEVPLVYQLYSNSRYIMIVPFLYVPRV